MGKLANFLSHDMTVHTSSGKGYETVVFKEGLFEKRETGKAVEPRGTTVKWTASEEFFEHPEVDYERIKSLLKTLACLCPGLTFNVNYEGKEEVFQSKNGLHDLVDDAVKDTEIIKNRLSVSSAVGKNKLDLVMTYTGNYSSTFVTYVNTGLVEQSPILTQIKTAITREINKFFRDRGWLKEKEDNLSGDDIQEGMYMVFNATSPSVSYDSQVKTRVVAMGCKNQVAAFIEALQQWMELNEKEIKGIADKALIARKARDAARKAKEAARAIKPKEKGLKAKMALSNKFIDCTSKVASERNLLLVEGLSAGSAAVEARNEKTDCIYMLRGKVLSPLKSSIDKILSNQEYSDIIKVIGGGFGNDKFDVSKMNFDKIVITCDADSDGSSIELLLITFFFTYMRPLVMEGRLYRAVTPLYIVKSGGEELYFYTEAEMDNYRASSTGKYEILRCKGLGELNAQDLHDVCFKDQRFKRITVADVEEAERLLEVLEGQAVQPRKQFIYDNAERLGFNFD